MNPLERGFYTLQEAALLIEVGNARRIRGWLNGYERREIGPLLRRDYHRIGDTEELSFHDLMEIRFVEFFREAGANVRTLRNALESARDAFGVEKPLATNKVRFTLTPDKKKIIVSETDKPIATRDEDRKLWLLLTRQYEHYELIHEQIERGVTFDPANHLAKVWKPRPESFPEIIVNPRIAYGRPVVPSGTPTAVLYDALQAHDDIAELADWYDISPAEAQMAINFERALRVGAEVAAA